MSTLFNILKFWGDGSNSSKLLVNQIVVRSTKNFNWSFIALLSIMVYVYATEYKNKQYKNIAAGLSLYGVHWLYEIANAVIAHYYGYPLWAVSNNSTTYILLIGVCWELSMMFSIAGIISYKILPENKDSKFLFFNCKFTYAIFMALGFALFESFLAATENNSFIWVYEWWGVLPVFITTYIPFFLACNYIPEMKWENCKKTLIFIWGLVFVLLNVLIPAKII